MKTDKVALVVAAGSGMGAAVARKLAAHEYKVAILSSSGRGEALAAELGGLGVTGSNQSVADLQRLVDAAVETFGGIDAVVNSAGHGPKGSILEISDEDWHQGMEVYFLNVVRVARLVTTHLLASGGGAIVNISSFAAFEPDPAFPTSGAFRASLASFTKLYADEFASKGIRMNNVLPGFIDSLTEKKTSESASRWGATEPPRRLRRRWRSCSRTGRTTSPGRTSASTGESRARCRDPTDQRSKHWQLFAVALAALWLWRCGGSAPSA